MTPGPAFDPRQGRAPDAPNRIKKVYDPFETINKIAGFCGGQKVA
jgi:hypothetical protein